LSGGFAGSRPARRPEVLAAHLVKHTAALHGYFSEALAWDSVNFAIAPLLVGLTQREMKQIAQALFSSCLRPASHAVVSVCIAICIWIGSVRPIYRRLLSSAQAVKTDHDLRAIHAAAARDFLQALFEVHLEGDGQGCLSLAHG
jgi:anaerobic ribonucleoside-triphosphate reductase